MDRNRIENDVHKICTLLSIHTPSFMYLDYFFTLSHDTDCKWTYSWTDERTDGKHISGVKTDMRHKLFPNG